MQGAVGWLAKTWLLASKRLCSFRMGMISSLLLTVPIHAVFVSLPNWFSSLKVCRLHGRLKHRHHQMIHAVKYFERLVLLRMAVLLSVLTDHFCVHWTFLI